MNSRLHIALSASITGLLCLLLAAPVSAMWKGGGHAALPGVEAWSPSQGAAERVRSFDRHGPLVNGTKKEVLMPEGSLEGTKPLLELDPADEAEEGM